MTQHLPRIQRMTFSTLPRASSPGHAWTTGILLRSGAAECSLERRFVLRPGELYVIPARARHAFLGPQEANTEGWAFTLPDTFGCVSSKRPVMPLGERSHVDLDAWLLRIYSEQFTTNACSRALRDALYQAVHIECARALGLGHCASESRLVSRALDVIQAGFRNALRPRDIAARIGVSPAHLSHEMRRQTGRSPSEWIIHARIEAAKQHLLSAEVSVRTVAEQVGYADVSQLNRHFLRETGLSPDRWRRANKAHISAK
ncbi:MAG: helix-turn-helix domain-containing protein [Steroidobacteraceae bacterium]|nr:helix-turn-helix domain-containing protein [Steroidobacteraceae bacterium]